MPAGNTDAIATADREVVITRVVNAPRELVWEAFTNPKHVGLWWGPTGFTNTVHSIDVRPGGVWLFDMHGPDGTIYPNRIAYSEVKRPERLAFKHTSAEEDDPHGFEVVVTFEAQGKRTLITMRSVFQTAAARDFVVREFKAIEGGNQTLDKLEQFLRTLS